jgi:predicted NBD/HSP70 family sugar kinase
MPLSQVETLEVLKLIRTHVSISRTDVANITGASPFLISKICDKLLTGGFITEAGQGNSTGGRRPTLLSLRPGLGRLIGVDLGTVNVRIAITDFSGKTIDFFKGASHSSEGPDVALKGVMEEIGRMLKRNAVSLSELDGIGIGVSGVAESSTGTVLYWPKLPLWVEVPVKSIFENRFKTVVELQDTSRTRAFAEYRLGNVNSTKNFVYIAVGAGIGAALFFDGKLYTGTGGFAGEFGHITVSETGQLCSCGNRGCLETLVSASALILRAREGLAAGLSNALTRMTEGDPNRLSVEMLARAAKEGDRFARSLLSEAGTYLGRGIVGLINLLNPELIVIGAGPATAVGDLLLLEIERVVSERAMVQNVRQVEIRISTLQEKDWAVGATLIVAEKALAQSFLRTSETKKRVPR